MTKPILVPLDGSALAERALPFAAALARVLDAPLLLVRAVVVPEDLGYDPARRQLEAVDDAEAYLRRLAADLGRQGTAVETVVPYGEAAGAILDAARASEARLIAMTTHGRGGLGNWLAGGVATAVLARAPAPVLLVRAWHAGGALDRLERGARIVVPLDGSALAEAALPLATRLAGALGGELLLVRAVPPPGPALTPDGLRALVAGDEEVAAETAEARAYLAAVAGRLAARDYAVGREVRLGAPAVVIDAVCRERGAALVVLATHGRTGLDRLLLGSVAEAVVRHGSAPVVLVRPARHAAGPGTTGGTAAASPGRA
ncbi:MAG TPA: universal stress protein [Thermomicrobiales bacterium]|nr:universal stress protein [Thermomicrobiales bacterium]